MRIVTLDNKSYDLEDYNVIVKDFNVSSILLEPTYAHVEGADGQKDMGASALSRSITVPITMKAEDLMDYPLLRDVIFNLVVSKKPFYIHEMRRPKNLAYNFVDTNESGSMDVTTNNIQVTGKRYLVRLSNQFEFDQLNVYGDAELVFETTELPYAESIGTTQVIQRNGVDAESHLWSYGMGIIDEPASQKYTFNSNSFKVFNAGNVEIEPFEQELKITINNVIDSTNSFELLNKTNGSFVKFTKKVNSGDTIIIDGAMITRNSAQALRDTTRNFIRLSEGYNQFEINGATNASIEFDFRYYYK